MSTQTITIPASILDQVGTNPAITSAVAHAHPVSNISGQIIHLCAMYGGNRYAVTQEQSDAAKVEFERMKQEKANNVGNRLTFVGMGMNYAERYADDVCNHRIRTVVLNPAGRRFFIEVGTGRGENMRIDHVIDLDQRDEYQANLEAVHKKIEEAGGFYKCPQGSALRIQLERWQAQPYEWYKKDEWFSLNTQYTKANVLKLVNRLFDCHFDKMEVEYYLLRTEDYVSTSPAFDRVSA